MVDDTGLENEFLYFIIELYVTKRPILKRFCVHSFLLEPYSSLPFRDYNDQTMTNHQAFFFPNLTGKDSAIAAAALACALSNV